jgi:uncharacterized phage protein (TIGR01671 family)
MRDIKFRAWDNGKMQKVSFNNLYVNFYHPKGTIYIRDEMKPFGKTHETILMQYTGLKDKNGKEIYEGDILGKEGYWDFYIGFKDACFVLIPCNQVQRANWEWTPVGKSKIEGWGVIGNIYQNPDLLETKP